MKRNRLLKIGILLVSKRVLTAIIVLSVCAVIPATAADVSVIRDLPEAISPGEEFEVSLTQSGFYFTGSVTETLPEGFKYRGVLSGGKLHEYDETTNELTMDFDSETSITYIVKAGTAEQIRDAVFSGTWTTIDSKTFEIINGTVEGDTTLTLTEPTSGLDIAVSSDPDPATVNQILSVTLTRASDGSPVGGALVQYILNSGTPINTFTDASGISSFKPQLIGTLDIIATKAEEGLSSTITVEVVGGLDIAVSSDPDPATVNQILSVTVTRASDGSPVEGALVQYILNHGTPINTFTDASGISSFKPQLTGTLDIIATKAEEGLSSTITVEVVERLGIAVSSDPDPATVNQILSVTLTRASDGSPVEGALVQYILNSGTPINTFTDASGISSFKPQLTGTLDIIVTKANEGLSGTRTVEVVERLGIAVSSDPDPATVNQILSVTVTRASDGSPVEGALVQYILNSGTPINTFTDASGISSFKPQLTGTLDIIVTKANEGLSGTRTVEVVDREG
ncbi:MAG: hypothetical protein WBC40_03690 [Halobacteriota archaeon]